MGTRVWKLKNNLRRLRARIRYSPLLYKRVGGISAVVTRADGRVEDLGVASDIYAKRWRARA